MHLPPVSDIGEHRIANRRDNALSGFPHPHVPAGAQATWTQIPSPNRPGSNELQGAAGADARHVWAVGEGFNARTLVLHWNGVSWAGQASPSPLVGPKLYGAAAIGPSTVWAVGYRYDQRLAANQTLTIRTSG